MADTIYAMVNANPTVHAVSGFNEEGHPLLACGFASRATHMTWLNPNAGGVTCEECLKLRAPDDAPKENPMTDHPLTDQAEAGELSPIPGTIRRGEEARAETARMLMQATGATRPEDVIPLAMGRPLAPYKAATLAVLDLHRPSAFDGTDVPALVTALRAVLKIHQDGGESQGYLDDGSYGDLPHCCTECGSLGEYGVPYPCPTVAAITTALNGDAA